MSDSETEGKFIKELVNKYASKKPVPEEKAAEVEVQEDLEPEVSEAPVEEDPPKTTKTGKRKKSEKVAAHLEKARIVAAQKRKEYAAKRREENQVKKKQKHLDSISKLVRQELERLSLQQPVAVVKKQKTVRVPVPKKTDQRSLVGAKPRNETESEESESESSLYSTSDDDCTSDHEVVYVPVAKPKKKTIVKKKAPVTSYRRKKTTSSMPFDDYYM